MTEHSPVTPISGLGAARAFAFSGGCILVGVYVAMPVLLSRGTSFLAGYLLCFQSSPFALLWLQLLYFCRQDGLPLRWESVRERLWLTPSPRAFAAGLAVCVVGVGTYLPLQAVSRWLAATAWFTPPSWFPPELHPLKSATATQFMGSSVAGHLWPLGAYLVGWLLNVTSEELFFRGYLLPRQELRYGNCAWLVNGLMWLAWHVFWRWQLLALLPFCLLLPFAVQKLRSTWVGLVAHGLLNFLAVLSLAAKTLSP